ncbi:MAG: T9SS type A sorting domain-containing protein [Bacteroidetes bacterium]|nr:T9SS type A sorting domain-containing protein [Bacteroidota bacterium]
MKMKKIYLACMSGLMVISISAQTKFWNNVPYQGAFPITDNTPATDWTSGWANFDPENTVYPAITMTVSADITANTTWTTGSIILLQNKIYVKNGATLTIQPGVIIRGDNATAGTLIITQGAKINAQGTASNPIVFTSNEAIGNRAEGDWGGVIILGKAVSNQGTSNIEGLAATTDTQFGGSDDQDSSGVLSYVRIEFPGVEFQPTKEINGLTMGAVGSKTQIDHIQVSFSGDDSYEWFGGTVSAKYLIAFRGLDDDFDTDFGFRGRIQFGLAIRDKDLSDAAGDSNSFESDNDASGSNMQPLTAAVFSNITIVGPKRDGLTALPVGEKFEKAFRIRRNSSVSIFNSLIIGWEKGLSVEGSATENNFTGDTAYFSNNLLVDLPAGVNVVTAASSFYATFFGSDMNDSTKTKTQVNWVNPFPSNLYDSPDFRLNTGSVAATGADFNNIKFAGQITSVSKGKDSEFSGVSVYPNPAQNNSSLTFELNNPSMVNISLHSVTGQEVVSILKNIQMPAGVQQVNINTEEFSSGIYFLNITVLELTKTIKLVVNK